MSGAQVFEPAVRPGSLRCPGEVFVRHARELRQFLRGRRGAHDAEDLVQESFVRLIETGRIQTVHNPRAWLYRTSANLASDAADHRRVRHAVHVEGTDVEAVPDRCADPARIADARQQATKVWSALQTLPQPCRQAFLFNRFDGLSQREIAVQMGISKKTVERYLLRALATCLAVANSATAN